MRLGILFMPRAERNLGFTSKFGRTGSTFASYLAMNGATLAEIAETLGHKTLAMVKRYAHLSEVKRTPSSRQKRARIKIACYTDESKYTAAGVR